MGELLDKRESNIDRNKLELIFYRKLTAIEVAEIPAHAVDLISSISDSQLLRHIIISELKRWSISQVAIRYNLPIERVRSIGRQCKLVK